jgi:uncharacterized protein YjcR
MFSIAERLNIAVSCVTIAIWRRRLSWVTVRISVPSSVTRPASVS